MQILVGATGSIVKGNVLDVNSKSLERALKDYDPQLYLKWNPKKFDKHGVWEVRRRPEYKSLVNKGSFEGRTIYSLEYYENPQECMVKEAHVLGYDILTWLKSHDTWVQTNSEKGGTRVNKWIDKFEAEEIENKNRLEEKTYSDAVYNMKQEKTALRKYREAILSGQDPSTLAKFWK